MNHTQCHNTKTNERTSGHVEQKNRHCPPLNSCCYPPSPTDGSDGGRDARTLFKHNTTLPMSGLCSLRKCRAEAVCVLRITRHQERN